MCENRGGVLDFSETSNVCLVGLRLRRSGSGIFFSVARIHIRKNALAVLEQGVITFVGENVSSEIVQVIHKEESGVASMVAIEAS